MRRDLPNAIISTHHAIIRVSRRSFASTFGTLDIVSEDNSNSEHAKSNVRQRQGKNKCSAARRAESGATSRQCRRVTSCRKPATRPFWINIGADTTDTDETARFRLRISYLIWVKWYRAMISRALFNILDIILLHG